MEDKIIQSIFITNSEDDSESKDISGRVTATCVLTTIPENATVDKMENWEDTMGTEWRWRFLEYDNRRTVEISFVKRESPIRKYYNRYGEWVERDVPKEYDQHVVKTFYYYN